MLPASAPSSFCKDELQRSLDEQVFGIQKFTLASASTTQAAACVVLLEGQSISIILNVRGYSLDPTSHPGSSTCAPEQVFETIEDLLQAVSPLYGQKRHALLLERLEKLT